MADVKQGLEQYGEGQGGKGFSGGTFASETPKDNVYPREATPTGSPRPSEVDEEHGSGFVPADGGTFVTPSPRSGQV